MEYRAKYLSGYPRWGDESTNVTVVVNNGYVRISEDFTARNIYFDAIDIADLFTGTKTSHSIGRTAAGAVIGGLAGGMIGLLAGSALGSAPIDKEYLYLTFRDGDELCPIVLRTKKNTDKLHRALLQAIREAEHREMSYLYKRTKEIPKEQLKTQEENSPILSCVLVAILELAWLLLVIWFIS